MSIYLEHHGIKGQKWGERHGPPYPLDSASSRRQTRRKERIKKNPTPKNLKKYKNDLTEDEIREAIQKIELDKRLDQINADNINRGVQVISNSANAIRNTIAAIEGIARVTGRAYNFYQQHFNPVQGTVQDGDVTYQIVNWDTLNSGPRSQILPDSGTTSNNLSSVLASSGFDFTDKEWDQILSGINLN